MSKQYLRSVEIYQMEQIWGINLPYYNEPIYLVVKKNGLEHKGTKGGIKRHSELRSTDIILEKIKIKINYTLV